MHKRPISSDRRTLVAALLIALVGTGAGGCSGSGACRELKDRYNAAMAAQRASFTEAPNPNQPPLLGTLVRQAAMDRIVDARIASMETLSDARHIELFGTTLNLNTRLLETDVKVGRQCEACLDVQAAVAVSASVKAGPVPMGVFKTRGLVRLEAPIAIDVRGGTSRLVTDLARAKVQHVQVELPGLPARMASAANDLLTESAAALLKGVGSEVVLLSWKPIAIPGSPLKITATEVKTLAPSGAVWIGWTPNVTLDGPGAALPGLFPPTADVAVTVAPQALTLLTQASALANLIPTRLNDDLQTDPRGALHVTVDQIRPDAGKLGTAFTLWRLEGDTCFEAHFAATTVASVVPPDPEARSRADRKARVALDVQDIELVDSRGDDLLLSAALWWRSTFTSESLAFQRDVLAAHDLAFGDASIDLHAVAIDTREDGIDVFLAASPGASTTTAH